jgi:uncharacterized protein (TIRG00374 family)
VAVPVTETPVKRGSRARKVVSAVVAILIVVGIFWYFLPQFADISDVWATIRSMTWLEITTLALLAVWNLLTYCFVLVVATPGLTLAQAFVVTESTTAVSNTIPGGAAIGIGMTYGMEHSWGFSRSRITLSVLLTGIWNNFAKLGLPVLALALLALQGKPGIGRILAGLIGIGALVAAIVVFALMLRSENTARRVGEIGARVASRLLRLIGRPPVSGWDRATTKFRARTILYLRARWLWLTLTTLVSHLTLFALLLTSLRDVGVSENEVSWIEVLAVFSFARLITAIPITPGGLGLVEITMIASLTAAGGSGEQVAAGVLVYRVLSYVLPIPLGGLTYLIFRRNNAWRRAPNTAPRTPLVPEQA